jgi:hypothetical protein
VSRVSSYAWMVLTALTTACGGPSLLVVGEAVRPPDPLLVVSVVDPSGLPISQAEVVIGKESRITDEAGTAMAEWKRGPLRVTAQAPGFLPGQSEVETFPEDAIYRLELHPVVLSGRIIDPAGRPVPGASVRLGDVEAASDTNGRFKLIRAAPGELRVERPAWLTSSVSWEGDWEGDALDIVLEPRIVRALYATGRAAAGQALWDELLGEARRTEINGMVVDLKDSSGTLFYDSQVPLAREAGVIKPAFQVRELLADLEAEDLYAIARLVAFEDPVVALARPELAVWDTGRNAPWRSDAGRAWLDPTDPAAQDYLIALANEACRLGFDEIQFDYVRFPTDGPLIRARFDGGYNAEVRSATISSFLRRTREVLHAEGCVLAADIFGFVTRAVDEGSIGQQVETVSETVDVISPMIYPSHYRQGWYGFDLPNDHPAEVVGRAIDDGLDRMAGTTIMRPWLQAFSLGAGISYGPAQIRSQIDQAETRGLGWMLWNAGSRFNEQALQPAG